MERPPYVSGSNFDAEVTLPGEPGVQLRVIVVDDSPEFVNSALRCLAFDPVIEVVGCASSGKEALSLVQDLSPDLVLMDLAMPEMNGLEATRQIKSMPEPPRVVILTLYDDPAYRDAAVEVGADGFVTKADWTQQMPHTLGALFGPKMTKAGAEMPRPASTPRHDARV